MITSTTEFDMPTVLQREPRLVAVLSALRQHVSAFCIFDGSVFPSIIAKENQHLPLIVIASRRITDEWLDSINGAELTLDGCREGFESRAYLAWQGRGGSLAINTYDVDSDIGEQRGVQQAHVLWLTDTWALLGWVDTDKHFQDLLYVASRSRYLSRFVPDADYVEQKMKSYPLPISPEEEILIGSDGEPMYVACKVDFSM